VGCSIFYFFFGGWYYYPYPIFVIFRQFKFLEASFPIKTVMIARVGNVLSWFSSERR
jgi:hypothetical protein